MPHLVTDLQMAGDPFTIEVLPDHDEYLLPGAAHLHRCGGAGNIQFMPAAVLKMKALDPKDLPGCGS